MNVIPHLIPSEDLYEDDDDNNIDDLLSYQI